MPRNRGLITANRNRQDEFYTQLTDIERECRHYRAHFRGKVIFCNCDDPYESNFFKYFAMNFNVLGLKKLIATSYAGSPVQCTELDLFSDVEPEPAAEARRKAYKIEIRKVTDENGDGSIDLADVECLLRRNPENTLVELRGDGDFRSAECQALLREADIVVTNPPFSLFREYIAVLMRYEKKFLILGNHNAITYQDFFPLLITNRVWLGASIHSGDREFRVPDYYPLTATNFRIDANGTKYIRVKSVRWFTNLDYRERHEDLELYTTYRPERYPKYDNYNAIEVGKTAEIPGNYTTL